MTSTDPQQPSTTTPDAGTDATVPVPVPVPVPEVEPAVTADAAPEAPLTVDAAREPATADASSRTGPDAAPEVAVTAVVDPSAVRRAPRFKAFALTGIMVGLIVSAALNLFALEPGHPGWSRSILTLEVTLAGLVVGVVWALVADRRSRR